ncbi:MAG: phosphatase PAP2 family protein [Bacteroidota bacterium]
MAIYHLAGAKKRKNGKINFSLRRSSGLGLLKRCRIVGNLTADTLIMKNLFEENKLYFLLLGCCALLGGIYLFFYEKPEMIYFFSAHRQEALNTFFVYFTKMGEEAAYLLFGLFFLTKKIRHGLLVGLIGFVVMGLSFALKAYFAIDRPLAFFRKNNLLDQVNLVPNIDLHSGASSFPSGHSMSAFALYGLLILLLPTKKRYVFPLLLMAIGVAISRVYLVQHFYVDVYAGSMIGAVVAVLFFILDKNTRLEKNHFLEKSILDVFNKS